MTPQTSHRPYPPIIYLYRYERDGLAKQKQRELAERHRAELEAELESLLEAQSMQRRLLEGKQQLVSTGELEVGQLQARASSTITTKSSNASRDSSALTPHPSPYTSGPSGRGQGEAGRDARA